MENDLIEDRDIIMMGMQPWDVEIGSNFKNMAMEISKHHRVLYVNRPLDRMTAIQDRGDKKTITRLESIKKNKGVLQEAIKNLWVFNPRTMLESVNWMPPGKSYEFLNKLNNKKLSEQVKFARQELELKNPLLIIDNDFFNGLYLGEYLGIDCTVYYLRDYLLSQPYFYKHGKKSEAALIRKSQVVATNSLYLADYAKQNNKNTFYIGQGCDAEAFEKKSLEVPSDIVGIKYPVIGYCGALLALRLDIELLISIATKRPNWNLVLVGPEDETFRKSRLHKLSNVHFLGHKDSSLLPAYVHCFDVCLNPQVINEMTIGNYPRKVDEYLAAGKPVVATSTKAMEEFAECTYLCEGSEGYLSAIEFALSSDTDDAAKRRRMEIARSHSWGNSIMKLYDAIDEHLKKKQYA